MTSPPARLAESAVREDVDRLLEEVHRPIDEQENLHRPGVLLLKPTFA